MAYQISDISISISIGIGISISYLILDYKILDLDIRYEFHISTALLLAPSSFPCFSFFNHLYPFFALGIIFWPYQTHSTSTYVQSECMIKQEACYCQPNEHNFDDFYLFMFFLTEQIFSSTCIMPEKLEILIQLRSVPTLPMIPNLPPSATSVSYWSSFDVYHLITSRKGTFIIYPQGR